jgi:methylated-DNA-protein-cysteine methyltransferase-like protein
MPRTGSFFTDVHAVARLIPTGRFTTYGAIAKYLGSGLSARMVGWAMNAAHADPTIPAHRVLNRNGELTGRHHFSPPESMAMSLEAEGIKVIDNQVAEFEGHFWDPANELL